MLEVIIDASLTLVIWNDVRKQFQIHIWRYS